jgi:hypothetical protein
MKVNRIGTKAQHESELELDMKVSRIGAGAQHEGECLIAARAQQEGEFD